MTPDGVLRAVARAAPAVVVVRRVACRPHPGRPHYRVAVRWRVFAVIDGVAAAVGAARRRATKAVRKRLAPAACAAWCFNVGHRDHPMMAARRGGVATGGGVTLPEYRNPSPEKRARYAPYGRALRLTAWELGRQGVTDVALVDAAGVCVVAWAAGAGHVAVDPVRHALRLRAARQRCDTPAQAAEALAHGAARRLVDGLAQAYFSSAALVLFLTLRDNLLAELVAAACATSAHTRDEASLGAFAKSLGEGCAIKVGRYTVEAAHQHLVARNLVAAPVDFVP